MTLLERRWHESASLVAEARDVIVERAISADPPPAIAKRGWDAFLRTLSEDELAACERSGLGAALPSSAPDSLRAFVEDVRAACDVPRLEVDLARRTIADPRHVKPRKALQVRAFVEASRHLASQAERIVDVGSGHGHLTRELASQMKATALGIERDPLLVQKANAWAAGSSAAFVVQDALASGASLRSTDCVVALHGCGELADALVTMAAAAGASVAFVGCCLQKRRAAWRDPLSAPERTVDLRLPKEILGLSNLSPRSVGVEATLEENLVARERRLAIRVLLERRGVVHEHGQELCGLNRRAAHESLPELAARVFRHKQLPLPSTDELADAERQARARRGLLRRWNLPREALARLLEVHVLFDRARYLAQRDYEVTYGVLFDDDVSARNLAVFAAPPS